MKWHSGSRIQSDRWSGDCDTLEVGRSAGGKLGKNPAIGELVVENDWIAGIIGLAVPTESRPERIVRCRTEERVPALVEDLEMQVGHRHHMIETDRSIGVRGRATAQVAVPIETDNRSRYSDFAKHSLHNGVGHDRTKGRQVRQDIAVFVLAQRAFLTGSGFISRKGGEMSNFTTGITPRYCGMAQVGCEVTGSPEAFAAAPAEQCDSREAQQNGEKETKFKECGLRSGFLFHWMKFGLSGAFADTLEGASTQCFRHVMVNFPRFQQWNPPYI